MTQQGYPVTRVEVRIVCDGQELKVRGSKFLNEQPPESRRIRSTDDLEKTIETYVNLYNGTSTQFSISSCYGSTCVPPEKWILTPRKHVLLKLTNVKGNNKSDQESYKDAIIREFEEETGSRIPGSFFHQESPTMFCLNIDTSAKAILDKNFELLKPATEIYEWKWVSSSSSQAGLPCGGDVVMPEHISQSPVTQAVIKAKATLKKTGGKTIRQKKSKHSKKRGTLKRGNRR